jgi:hypothetical protein
MRKVQIAISAGARPRLLKALSSSHRISNHLPYLSGHFVPRPNRSRKYVAILLIVTCLSVCVLFLPRAVHASTTTTFQLPTADNYLDQNAPTTNRGTSNELDVQSQRARFDTLRLNIKAPTIISPTEPFTCFNLIVFGGAFFILLVVVIGSTS